MRALDLLTTVPTDSAPRAGADRSTTAVAEVTAVSRDGATVTVRLLGSEPIPLPATVSVWSGVRTCYVLLSPITGRPVHVLGPAPAPTGDPVADPDAVTDPQTTQRTTTITPTWSGTWRAGRGWDRWNVQRYGGRTDLYQGSTGASGPLTGIAVYGSAVTALAATSITTATLTITSAARRSFDVVLQAATRTDTGPTTTGPTVTATAAPDPTEVDVTALAGGLLAGMGVALVGPQYGAVGGLGESMALTLDYEVSQ